MINWQADTNSEIEFDFTEEPKQVGNSLISSICLTKDEKYLLVGSYEYVRVFETATREVIKKFKLRTYVMAITLIKDGEAAIVGELNSNVSIIDLKTLKISPIAERILKGEQLNRILLI